jgi:Ca-activated chloride channel family protein
MMKSICSSVMMLVCMLGLFGCEEGNGKISSSSNGISIIAGSEIQNIEPIINMASKELGFPINIKYSGTIEGVEAIKSTNDYDVAWFGNSKYFYDTPESAKKIRSSEKIMLSPVIVGVKPESYTKYKLESKKEYTWSDISKWVSEKKMTFAMSDPSVSNTGYVALMGVVYSTTNKGENINVKDVNKNVLQDFFKGQKVTGKSSNWIMEQFNKSDIDFVINYESVILNNASKLMPIYPKEGIITADYQMILVNGQKEDNFRKLANYLKQESIQNQLLNNFKYRSVNSDVMKKQNIFDETKLLIEMPFNPSMDVSTAILDSYFNIYKKPSKFAFVVDTSGSMQGSREMKLKSAIEDLTKGTISKYANIRDREEVLVIPFSDSAYDLVKFNSTTTSEMSSYIKSLRMDGGTSMFSSVAAAMLELKRDKKVNGDKYHYSVIVFTDGVSNTGMRGNEFESWYENQHFENGEIRVFAIVFGEADMNQLNLLTKVTGGQVFDGQTSLTKAFKDIRSYQ